MVAHYSARAGGIPSFSIQSPELPPAFLDIQKSMISLGKICRDLGIPELD
jgi:hypothetical protein